MRPIEPGNIIIDHHSQYYWHCPRYSSQMHWTIDLGSSAGILHCALSEQFTAGTNYFKSTCLLLDHILFAVSIINDKSTVHCIWEEYPAVHSESKLKKTVVNYWEFPMGPPQMPGS